MPLTIAVTGATGFIGGALVPLLIAQGHPVRALSRSRVGGDLLAGLGAQVVEGDLLDSVALERLVTGADVVINLAGTVRGRCYADFEPANVIGVDRLLGVLARQRRPIRLLHVSSLAAREPALSPYCASKAASETLVEGADPAIDWSLVRPPAVYGPGDRELAPLWRAMARGLVTLPANPRARFSLLHVDDLASALLALANQPPDPANRQTFEPDDGRAGGYDWYQVLAIASELLQRPVRGLPVPAGLLKSLAWGNRVAAGLFGYAPMLTPGKVRELLHPDWVSRGNGAPRIAGWQPRNPLPAGLVSCLPGASSATVTT